VEVAAIPTVPTCARGARADVAATRCASLLAGDLDAARGVVALAGGSLRRRVAPPSSCTPPAAEREARDRAAAARARAGPPPRASQGRQGRRRRQDGATLRRRAPRRHPPGDLVGAIAGESGVPSRELGAIEIEENFAGGGAEARLDEIIAAMKRMTCAGARSWCACSARWEAGSGGDVRRSA
jgi:hypothetical protein